VPRQCCIYERDATISGWNCPGTIEQNQGNVMRIIDTASEKELVTIRVR
jgi:hypothetical protein